MEQRAIDDEIIDNMLQEHGYPYIHVLVEDLWLECAKILQGQMEVKQTNNEVLIFQHGSRKHPFRGANLKEALAKTWFFHQPSGA